jgi:glyoxylase-like metal-dependent hydrolase (beta-lactamase superfamily II)
MKSSARIWRVAALLLLVLIVSGLAWQTRATVENHARVPKGLRLYVFDCGIIQGLDPGLFSFKKEELAETKLAVPCYLIVDKQGTLMWDVGVIPDTDFKDDGKPVTEGPSTATVTLKSQLAEIGYAPADITYLAMSHYHGDHIANANEFASATWLVRPVERDAMFAEKPPALVNPKFYDKLRDAQTVLIARDEYDVFGDGKVIIKSAPGHTPGHQVLILHLQKTGNVMIAGDLYHYPEERKLNRVPTFEFDKDQTLKTRAAIEDYCKRTNTQLWIEHDYAANSKLKKSPKYYE